MGDFQRSPSKVWWASGNEDSLNWRAASASPGSQDSGFSDTETSPHNREKTPPRVRADLEKSKGNAESPNLKENLVEKTTPMKSFKLEAGTPLRRPSVNCMSEPSGRFTKNKNHQKVSRNLFRSIQMESTMGIDQYAKDVCVPSDGDVSWSSSSDSSELPDSVRTLPLPKTRSERANFNNTAPAGLCCRDAETDPEADGELDVFSDSDSELECLFRGDSPKHTSTPKATVLKRSEHVHLGRIHAMNLLQKYKNERVPPTTVETVEEGTALAKWMSELKPSYEPECMITLQCKSVAGELSDKVTKLAAITTSRLRLLLYYNNLIEQEFDNLKNQKKHQLPLAQSLVGLLQETLQHFTKNTEIQKQCDKLKTAEATEIPKLTAQLHLDWNTFVRFVQIREVQHLVKGLEDPSSEVDVRAKLTGITSLALHNENLIETLLHSRAVQVITIICEKCEGSSVRGLALRALSTLCVNADAIRKFESCEGVAMLGDVITDESRPEPERTEAVALLAQITAPWIEDNHSVAGLHKQSKRLVKHLTKILVLTRCCQTVLLCTAALANITAMDTKCVKHLIQQNTVNLLLETVRKHGAGASIYLLEQVATLIANMSAVSDVRPSLANDGAAVALLCFLKSSCMDDEVVRRLQQKSIIGLSRLCGEAEAAKQVVERGGVDRLVELCREKKERFDSDAILVAALATLRKIAEVCGVEVVNQEDAQELIEPRLLDSFMAYSAQSESLV